MRTAKEVREVSEKKRHRRKEGKGGDMGKFENTLGQRKKGGLEEGAHWGKIPTDEILESGEGCNWRHA